MQQFSLVICGGTFDLFHAGHKDFLRFVLSKGKKVIIGITSDEYVKENKLDVMEPFEKRKNTVKNFLIEQNSSDNAQLLKINDLYGPTLDPKLSADALIVSKDSEKGAFLINSKRKELGLPEFLVIVSPLYLVDGEVVSSSHIREGKINREGAVYEKKEWFSQALLLPQGLREELRKPFGKIITEFPKNLNSDRVITVGDVVTKKANENHINQKLSIVDFLVERKKKFTDLSEHGFNNEVSVRNVKNSPGELTPSLFEAVKDGISSQGPSVILVEGEEDLAVLPAIIYAHLGYHIFYGQPGAGMVEIEVSENIKEKAFTIIGRFTRGY